MKTIAIVDDDPSALRALVRLARTGGYEAVPFSSAEALLSDDGLARFDCVVSDLRMPETDGLDLLKAIAQRCPYLALIMITGAGDVRSTVTAMKAGALDILEKPIKAKVLLDAIGEATERTEKQRSIEAESHHLRARYATLTSREQEVFSLVAAGLLNKQVAFELGIAEKTVKQHRARVTDKMGAYSLGDLAIMAEALGARPRISNFSGARGIISESAESKDRTKVL